MSETYEWALAVAPTRKGVQIPVPHKFITVLLYLTHKQELEEPDVLSVLLIKSVVPFEAGKEGPP